MSEPQEIIVYRNSFEYHMYHSGAWSIIIPAFVVYAGILLFYFSLIKPILERKYGFREVGKYDILALWIAGIIPGIMIYKYIFG